MLLCRHVIAAALGVALLLVGASAQENRLTIDSILDPDVRASFDGQAQAGLTWLDDDTYLWPRRSSTGVEWLKVDAVSGRAVPAFDAEAMTAAFASLPGLSVASAGAVARDRALVFNETGTSVLVSVLDDLYAYDFESRRASRLTSATGREEQVSFSPDGRMVAFVRGNDLYTVRLSESREHAITTDGDDRTLNGVLDWVYQEEIYGRGNARGYWWSPDSRRIALLRLDEHSVPEYTRIDLIPHRPISYTGPYPKAGDPNPTVQLGIADASGGELSWIDLAAYEDQEILIVDVAWSANGARVAYQVQNREQTWLDLNVVPSDGGGPTRILRETTPAWVEVQGGPVWMGDDSFLWSSDRSGFRHLYRYSLDGSLVSPVTSGQWDVRRVHGVDPNGRVFFDATERSVIGQDLYRIDSSGTGMVRLSQREGRHRARFNPGLSRYLGFWSDVSTPTQVRLHDADGVEIRVIDTNPVTGPAEYVLQKPEFLQVTSRDGFVMEAMMIKPRDFDPRLQYPVYQSTYAGPGTQSVMNAWGGASEYLFFQLLAQRGVIVWVLDNRSASGKGAASRWPIYGRLGEVELRDIEDGVAWLRTQPYVDASRIVLSGWSYGGFMTAYALTHSTSFAAGIAGAPVTDWRNYDSVYTERYMKIPAHNEAGYDRTAPTRAAARLHGHALLIHGSTDDNVHLQNTEQFAYELQRAGRSFELMIYPKSGHGITDADQWRHMRRLMFDFVMRTVGESSQSADVGPVALFQESPAQIPQRGVDFVVGVGAAA